MKTIAVLTDYSEGAEHATQFACHMAKKMKANVLLFSTCSLPVVQQPALAGLPDLEPVKEHPLEQYGRAMTRDMETRTFPGSYIPDILVDCENIELVDVMTAIMRNEQISLIVSSPASEYDLASYMLSDECNRIIDWATIPVLIVPETAPIRNFEKMVFNTQLHEEDINSIAELGSLMESFAAELMVAHLNNDPSNTVVSALENELNRDLYKKLDCGGVYFRRIADTEEIKNWDWLKANKRTDLLAVVQSSREQMARFFTRGRNMEVTYHLTLPVMVLPKRP